MAEIYDEGQNNNSPGFDFEAAKSQFTSSRSLAGLALEAFGVARATYPVYSCVQDNMVSVVQWTGAPNT
jgi:hypothetical protein